MWDKKISRREFIKKSVVGIGGIAIGAYAVKDLFYNTGNIITVSELEETRREAYYYSSRRNGVRCELCPNLCNIGNGMRSTCKVRIAENNKLYTVAYGNPCAVHVDPIEKKPLFHFLPATSAFSIALMERITE